MKVVIAGGTGFLGALLVRCLRAEGHLVTVLTRSPHASGQVAWNPANTAGPWALAVEAADAVIAARLGSLRPAAASD